MFICPTGWQQTQISTHFSEFNTFMKTLKKDNLVFKLSIHQITSFSLALYKTHQIWTQTKKLFLTTLLISITLFKFKQERQRPRRPDRQSSTQTGTLRKWESEVWTRSSPTFSAEPSLLEFSLQTLWSRWVRNVIICSLLKVFLPTLVSFQHITLQGEHDQLSGNHSVKSWKESILSRQFI